MKPDLYSPEYQRMLAVRSVNKDAERARRAGLHQRAVARRRKRKNGGPK